MANMRQLSVPVAMTDDYEAATTTKFPPKWGETVANRQNTKWGRESGWFCCAPVAQVRRTAPLALGPLAGVVKARRAVLYQPAWKGPIENLSHFALAFVIYMSDKFFIVEGGGDMGYTQLKMKAYFEWRLAEAGKYHGKCGKYRLGGRQGKKQFEFEGRGGGVRYEQIFYVALWKLNQFEVDGSRLSQDVEEQVDYVIKKWREDAGGLFAKFIGVDDDDVMRSWRWWPGWVVEVFYNAQKYSYFFLYKLFVCQFHGRCSDDER